MNYTWNKDVIINDDNIRQIEKLSADIQKSIDNYYKVIHNNRYIERQKFISKTYKFTNKDNNTTYYKILSICQDNEYRANTLYFTLPIIDVNDNSIIKDNMMDINDIGWWCLSLLDTNNKNSITMNTKNVIEISNDEFNNMLTKYNSDLISILTEDILHEQN